MTVLESDRDQTVPQPPPRRRSRKRRTVLAVFAGLVLALTPVAWSIGHALTAPGSDSTSARMAEWARDHHGGWFVNWMERLTYSPPKVGGVPPTTSPLVASPAGGTARVGPSAHDLPPAITPPATPPLPGEGRWHVLSYVGGRPAIAAAYVRPDAQHTSYTAAVTWMDPTLVRAVFHPGSQQPGGGPWPVAPRLTAAEHTGLLAAFNSAFRLQDARGGFYGYGRTLRPLRQGAASLVIDRSGGIQVGSWGRDVTMRPDTLVVRQNLALVVDRGQPAAGLADNSGGQWGYTLGNSLYVWRSGIGVTRSGDLVFVTGNRLSAVSLADLMIRAGAVRGMELDINPEWTSFVLYRTATGQPEERNLLPDMQRSPGRYDVTSTRDFIALYAR